MLAVREMLEKSDLTPTLVHQQLNDKNKEPVDIL